MKYVFEKGCSMPLCGCDDNNYYKFENGEIIDNLDVINFINNGLTNKTMNIKEVELIIYKIVDTNGNLIAYNYTIDKAINYLDIFKQPLSKRERTYVVDKLMNSKLKQELLWGVNNE